MGNPANTNCFLAKFFAPSLSGKQFSALTRLDHNRARAQVAARCGVEVDAVKNTCIWGNHSATQFPDISHSTVNIEGVETSAREAVGDDTWVEGGLFFFFLFFFCLFLYVKFLAVSIIARFFEVLFLGYFCA